MAAVSGKKGQFREKPNLDLGLHLHTLKSAVALSARRHCSYREQQVSELRKFSF